MATPNANSATPLKEEETKDIPQEAKKPEDTKKEEDGDEKLEGKIELGKKRTQSEANPEADKSVESAQKRQN